MIPTNNFIKVLKTKTFKCPDFVQVIDKGDIICLYRLYWSSEKISLIDFVSDTSYNFDVLEIHPLDLLDKMSFKMSREYIEKLQSTY